MKSFNVVVCKSLAYCRHFSFLVTIVIIISILCTTLLRLVNIFKLDYVSTCDSLIFSITLFSHLYCIKTTQNGFHFFKNF